MRKFLIVLVVPLLLGCASTAQLLPGMEQAREEIAARELFEQATEARLDGLIEDEAWACIKQIAEVIDAALDEGGLAEARSQSGLIRRMARGGFNACSE